MAELEELDAPWCDYVDCHHLAVWQITTDFGALHLCGGHFAELKDDFIGGTIDRI